MEASSWLMQSGFWAKLQTRAQSLARVPLGPAEKMTLAPSSILTPQTGQISVLEFDISIYPYGETIAVKIIALSE